MSTPRGYGICAKHIWRQTPPLGSGPTVISNVSVAHKKDAAAIVGTCVFAPDFS